MSHIHTIQEGFQSYRAEVMPAEAGENQVIETRRAFYAGAHVVLNMLVDVDSDKERALRLFELLSESIDFGALIGESGGSA